MKVSFALVAIFQPPTRRDVASMVLSIYKKKINIKFRYIYAKLFKKKSFFIVVKVKLKFFWGYKDSMN